MEIQEILKKNSYSTREVGRHIKQIFGTKNIRFKTPMLKLDLGNYSDAYIVVKVTITVSGH